MKYETLTRNHVNFLFLCVFAVSWLSFENAAAEEVKPYAWTTDHMQVGVRWQPFGRPQHNDYDGRRPVITEDSSYVQFWASWSAIEPTEANTDYIKHRSGQLQTIDRAVDACVAAGLKVELVFLHCPAWASVSGEAGPRKPKNGCFAAFATRMAKHFKSRVDAFQLYHEANLKDMMHDGDIDFLVDEIFTRGAEAIRSVYDASPRKEVILSTSGVSPCEACEALAGLKGGKGAVAADDFYDQLIASKRLMSAVDALNVNVSDQFNGYGMMDGAIIPSVWANYDLVRRKLDAAGLRSKRILSSESWIVWDGSVHAADVNADGMKNEQDAYDKTLTIMGRLLHRGLNTVNLPWSDNSSGWAMGLTKRRDYNGRVKQLAPDLVIAAKDGGADIVTSKILIQGKDDDFKIKTDVDYPYTIEDYINPADPNHLHYYVWRWFAQIAGGTDEVIRHAIAGEKGNDITVWGPAMTGNEQYKISSYNRTKEKFTVLIYSGGSNGKLWTKMSIPSTVQNGRYYNNRFSKTDFRGEGFANGDTYHALITTKDISRKDGSDVALSKRGPQILKVEDGKLRATIGGMNKFTMIEFVKVNESASALKASSE